MQAWWIDHSVKDRVGFQLENSFRIYIALVAENDNWQWVIFDKSGFLKGSLTIEEAKNIVAHKFATMLAEQAVAVLTIGA